MKVSASDIYNAPTYKTFDMNVDLKPRINSSVTVLSGEFVALEVSNFIISGKLFSDEDSTLTYTLTETDGSTLRSWMNLTSPLTSADNFTIAGTSTTFLNTDFNLILIATDSKGQSNSVTITVQMKGMFNLINQF